MLASLELAMKAVGRRSSFATGHVPYPVLIALLLALASPVRAQIDLTGSWDAQVDGPFGGAFALQITQTGTALTFATPSASWTGSFDPVTRSFSVSSGPNTPTCGDFTSMSGTASADGNFLGGWLTGEVFISSPPRCLFPSFALEATRSTCGNGVLDPGEGCDDGNRLDQDCCSKSCSPAPAGRACPDDGRACTTDTCDGAGACAHPLLFAGAICRITVDPRCDATDFCDGVSPDCPPDVVFPAGTICRQVDGDCDVAEVCTGTSGTCPPDLDHVDTDLDGRPDGCDVCPGGAPATAARLKLGLYDGVPANDKIDLAATIGISSASGALLDPVATGVEIGVLRPSSLLTEVRAIVPPGAYDPVTRQGWRASKSGTTWAFKSRDPDLLITKLRLRLRTGVTPTVDVKGSGKRLDFAAGSLLTGVQLAIALDPSTHAVCGQTRFAPPALCRAQKDGKLLNCR